MSETDDQGTIANALVNHAGAKRVGFVHGMPVVEDRGGNLWAITPTGDTLRAYRTILKGK